MDEFKEDWTGPDPRLNECPCGETATKVFLTTAFFSIDFLGDPTAANRGRTGGMNAGAGQTFLNRSHRREWMARSGSREICPEEMVRENAYLADARQAKADGVAAPEHPNVALQRKAVHEKAIANLQKRSEAAGRDVAAVENFTRLQAAEVMGREQGWSQEVGRAYVAGGQTSAAAFAQPEPSKVTVPIGSDGKPTDS